MFDCITAPTKAWVMLELMAGSLTAALCDTGVPTHGGEFRHAKFSKHRDCHAVSAPPVITPGFLLVYILEAMQVCV